MVTSASEVDKVVLVMEVFEPGRGRIGLPDDPYCVELARQCNHHVRRLELIVDSGLFKVEPTWMADAFEYMCPIDSFEVAPVFTWLKDHYTAIEYLVCFQGVPT